MGGAQVRPGDEIQRLCSHGNMMFLSLCEFLNHVSMFSFCLLQLSDLISVLLLSGTSATLSFRCNNESVQLPLSALPNSEQPKEMVRLCFQRIYYMISNKVQVIILSLRDSYLADRRNAYVRHCSEPLGCEEDRIPCCGCTEQQEPDAHACKTLFTVEYGV